MTVFSLYGDGDGVLGGGVEVMEVISGVADKGVTIFVEGADELGDLVRTVLGKAGWTSLE